MILRKHQVDSSSIYSEGKVGLRNVDNVAFVVGDQSAASFAGVGSLRCGPWSGVIDRVLSEGSLLQPGVHRGAQVVVHDDEEDVDHGVDDGPDPNVDLVEEGARFGGHEVSGHADPEKGEGAESGHLDGAGKGGAGCLRVIGKDNPPCNSEGSVCGIKHVDIGLMVLFGIGAVGLDEVDNERDDQHNVAQKSVEDDGAIDAPKLSV